MPSDHGSTTSARHHVSAASLREPTTDSEPILFGDRPPLTLIHPTLRLDQDHRLVVDGVLWRTRAGAAWRDLPGCYGNWKTVYNRHRRWSGDGTWRVVLSSLRTDCDNSDADEWVVGVDATVIRAHHHAAGARHEPPMDIPAEVLASVALEAPIRLLKDTGGTIELHEFR